MIPCISVENMRLSDAMTIEKYVPSLELMHRAAMGVFRAAHWHGKVAIVVGSGNNGGDGFGADCDCGFDESKYARTGWWRRCFGRDQSG